MEQVQERSMLQAENLQWQTYLSPLIPVREPAVLHSFFGTVFPYYASFLEW